MNHEKHARHPPGGKPSPKPPDNGHEAGPPAAGNGSKTDIPADDGPPKLTEREMLELLYKQLQELREYISFYAAAKTDSVKLSVRSAINRMVLLAREIIVFGGLIIMASWFVLSGIAQGLGGLFGAQAWIGILLTGVLALTVIGLGMYYADTLRKNATRERMAQKYETRHEQETRQEEK